MRRVLPLCLVAAVLCGCAYYNTFYSARKAWDKAMTERARNSLAGATAAEIGQYDLCIKACTNLLIRYPDSKYVDEAVLLIGRCMLGKGAYEPAANQFQLLCDSLPRSGLVPDALTGKGQALLKLRRFAEAESTLALVLDGFPDYRDRDQVLLTLGDALRQQKRSRDALEMYTRLIREFPDSRDRYQAQTYRGEAYFQLEEWDSARAEFDRVALDAPREDDRFAARLKVGEALERARRFEDAITYYRQQQIDLRSQSKELQLQRDPDLQLRVAGCEAQRGNVDKAIDMYASVKETNPNNRFGSAAAYQLGYLQEVQKEDFDKAREFYEACKTMPRSEFTDLAGERNSGLARAAEYRKKMAEGKTHFDARAETAYLLAELYCFDMKKYDRALAEYQGVERRFGFTRFGPKAAYASAWLLSRMRDSAAAESAFARVAVRYPATPFGEAALDSLRAHHGSAADSLLARARLDTTNFPLPRPPEAIADSIAQAVHADSLRRAVVADSLRRIAMSDSLRRDESRRRQAALADSAARPSRPKVPPGSSMPVIQAAELDSAGPPVAPPKGTGRPSPGGTGPPGSHVPSDSLAPGSQAPPDSLAPGSQAPPQQGGMPPAPTPPDSTPAAPASPEGVPPGPGPGALPDTSGTGPGSR